MGSSGVERLQLKWLATAGATVAFTYLASMIIGVGSNLADPGRSADPVWLATLQTGAILTFGLIPVAIGVAVLKHGLYGIDVVIKNQAYGDVAYGWAMEDTTSFCKLIADRATRKLVGAHIIGPQSSTLIQQLIQGMATGQTVDEMARGQYYIHPALPELIENALLGLEF